MENSPMTPSRMALGDISNKKLWKSTLKTPLSTVRETYEPAEINIGQVGQTEISSPEVQTDYSKDLLFEIPDYCFEETRIENREDTWSDPGFDIIDRQINEYLNLNH